MIMPFNIVLSHEEKWLYPHPDNPRQKLPSTKHTTKYYCVKLACIMNRFPYFDPSFVDVSVKERSRWQKSHLDLLKSELNFEGWCASPQNLLSINIASQCTWSQKGVLRAFIAWWKPKRTFGEFESRSMETRDAVEGFHLLENSHKLFRFSTSCIQWTKTTSKIAFLAFWLVYSILVIRSYTVWFYLETSFSGRF